ncbi:L-glutamate gamma-semialdehyde dehydrogenase [bacterium]|nr:L-glutamate gamma-semialdehyde dehydrogenase [bacterium]
MSNGVFTVPKAVNEPIKSYAPNSPERISLQNKLKEMKAEQVEMPMIIGGKKVTTGNLKNVVCPHDHNHVLGKYHHGTKEHVNLAIDSALKAAPAWANLSWEHRASIFLKASELLATTFRDTLNGSTMLGQSKNVFQAEIDSACELIDFFRFNVQFMQKIYEEQPISSPGIWNRLEHRPLEGFVFALTPFNFTSIAGNLPTSVALMGNVVVWKPSATQVYSAHFLMELFKAAGLPDGVINLVYGKGSEIGDVVFNSPSFAGVHFTGSTGVFQGFWKTIGQNIEKYKSYPRIVGETGGKDFIFAHKSADAKALAVAMVRGSFEYQGQKCSASSRAYVPSNLWEEVKNHIAEDLAEIKMGDVEDFSNFVNAVIDEASFDNCKNYIEHAKNSSDAKIIFGGNCEKTKGYFVEPTIIQTTNPKFKSMCEEIFGPILTVFVYDENKFEETLEIVNTTSPYALTGAIFAEDRYVIEVATKKLSQAAGNFYINDKPTGAVVGQQPFGGARASGTNDKAGSILNLLRWVSPRSIKETFVPPKNYRYPFLG